MAFYSKILQIFFNLIFNSSPQFTHKNSFFIIFALIKKIQKTTNHLYIVFNGTLQDQIEFYLAFWFELHAKLGKFIPYQVKLSPNNYTILSFAYRKNLIK